MDIVAQVFEGRTLTIRLEGEDLLRLIDRMREEVFLLQDSGHIISNIVVTNYYTIVNDTPPFAHTIAQPAAVIHTTGPLSPT